MPASQEFSPNNRDGRRRKKGEKREDRNPLDRSGYSSRPLVVQFRRHFKDPVLGYAGVLY
ncbi:MAG: hypothetical protein GVY23_02345 [Spirochaetes bacterium]|jgi:hypothetical protein|nr:hypothetical protein [Spirochaetota bacterium]